LAHQMGFVELFAEFFEFIPDQKMSKPAVHEDNTSVIICVAQRGGITREKYLRARMNIMMEAVVEQRVKIN
jgi:hypothetical protein